VRLICGDCLEVLPTLAEASVDAVVTDPPYGLEFMGKQWDRLTRNCMTPQSEADQQWNEARTEKDTPGTKDGMARRMRNRPDIGGSLKHAPQMQEWFREHFAAVLRVLKPGGYAAIFGGTRTYHRLACAVEDAGFEIRDSIMFMNSKPFDLVCNCGGNSDGEPLPYSHDKAKQGSQRRVRSVSVPNVSSPVNSDDKQGEVLQPGVSKQGAPPQGQANGSVVDEGVEQSGVEGRGDVPPSPGELRQRSICEVPAAADADGTEGRVCDGTQNDNGDDGVPVPHANGSGASHRPQPAEQRPVEPRTVAGQSASQTRGGGCICDRCGKPTVMPWGYEGVFPPYLAWIQGQGFPKGKGCLKPAWEPILLARKPGKRVLPLGIDECRIPTNGEDLGDPARFDGLRAGSSDGWKRPHHGSQADIERQREAMERASSAGRWPANVVHDGGEEVLEAFAAFGESSGVRPDMVRHNKQDTGEHGIYRRMKAVETPRHGDAGTAARFYYTAKASRSERGEGNTHPTVKPLALMRWLVRLVCPPGGVVLDPFLGSGTTAVACRQEGRDCVGIERDPAYFAIAERRLAGVSEDAPLFAAAAAGGD
jgi:DNA modification methylase